MKQFIGLLSMLVGFLGCSHGTLVKPVLAQTWPTYTLKALRNYPLNPPQGQRYDASGLLLTTNHNLLTINDKDGVLSRIILDNSESEGTLAPIPNVFSPAQLMHLSRHKAGHYDGEGIAQDEQGRLYICEEANRWILRFDPQTSKVTRLPIDWTPVSKYFSDDSNASFEGIAIGNGKLYVANERKTGRIIVVDLASMKVIDDFTVRPKNSQARDIHYSDLSWHKGYLYALLRESSIVLKVDPVDKRVLAQYNFYDLEREKDVAYANPFPTSMMEGLAVDDHHIWLLTDNNGLPRIRHPLDIRPILFQCPKPD